MCLPGFRAGKKSFIKKAIAAAQKAVPAQEDSDNGELSDSDEVDDNTMQAALLKALGVKHPKEYVSIDIGKQLDELHLSVCRRVLFCLLACLVGPLCVVGLVPS